MRVAAALLAFGLVASGEVASADAACRATTADDLLFATSIPGWYGTESLAVRLPSPAVWPTAQPGNPISGRVLWRSAGFRPGMEASLHISVESLDGAPVTGRISRATNAYIPTAHPGRPLSRGETEQATNEAIRRPDAWVMLTGVYFRDTGCWKITASYLGQTLTFVVETVASDRESADILSPIGGFNPAVIVAPMRDDGSQRISPLSRQ